MARGEDSFFLAASLSAPAQCARHVSESQGSSAIALLGACQLQWGR